MAQLAARRSRAWPLRQQSRALQPARGQAQDEQLQRPSSRRAASLTPSTNTGLAYLNSVAASPDVSSVTRDLRGCAREPDCASGAQSMPVGIGERLSEMAARAPRQPAWPRPSKVVWVRFRIPPRLTEADRGCTGRPGETSGLVSDQRPLPSPSRSSRLSTLPVAFLGRLSTNT